MADSRLTKFDKCRRKDFLDRRCRLDEGHEHGFPEHVTFDLTDDGKVEGYHRWRSDR